MELTGFNADTIEPNTAFEPLPAGWYKAVITESAEKPTKAMTGSYLQLRIEVIEGQHKGRVLFDRLNLKNPNETAVDIAQRTLSAICRAVNVRTPRSSSDLHDKPLMVKVAVKPATNGYDASNEIKGYEAPSAGGAEEKPTTSGGSTPPWKR
ncbi:MAG: DUF669 domain-containing protein [Rhodobacteraceae bacterium]|nr:DUF669 domain-containing protein [Paracoccaceae bacterium]